MPADDLLSPTPPAPADSWTERLGILPAAVLFVAVIIATLSLWRYTSELVRQNREREFQNSTNALVDDITDQIFQYRGTIMATRGLFVASEAVTRGEWRRYVETLNIGETAPSVSTLAYVAVVSHEELPEFLRQVRADTSDPLAPRESLENFAANPPGEREEYYLLTYIEPFLENLRAFGYDLRANPQRRETLELARDTGEVVASGKLSDLATGQPAFAIYAPIFRINGRADTVEERRQALKGFVLKVFETERFFGPIAEKGDEFARPIDFLVFDTGEADGTDSLLYSSNLAISTPGRIPESYLQLETWEPVFQRKWRIVFYQPPAAGPQSLADYVPQIILAAGAALGFFLFLSVASLTSSTLSGVQLARQMTQRLRLSEEQYRNIFASLRDLLFHTNLAGKILLINPSAENYLHRPPAELIGTQAELLFANPALFRDLLERIRKGEQIANVTTTLNQNGQSITVSVNAYVLRSDSGAAQEIEWVLRDISSRS